MEIIFGIITFGIVIHFLYTIISRGVNRKRIKPPKENVVPKTENVTEKYGVTKPVLSKSAEPKTVEPKTVLSKPAEPQPVEDDEDYKRVYMSDFLESDDYHGCPFGYMFELSADAELEPTVKKITEPILAEEKNSRWRIPITIMLDQGRDVDRIRREKQEFLEQCKKDEVHLIYGTWWKYYDCYDNSYYQIEGEDYPGSADDAATVTYLNQIYKGSGKIIEKEAVRLVGYRKNSDDYFGYGYRNGEEEVFNVGYAKKEKPDVELDGFGKRFISRAYDDKMSLSPGSIRVVQDTSYRLCGTYEFVTPQELKLNLGEESMKVVVDQNGWTFYSTASGYKYAYIGREEKESAGTDDAGLGKCLCVQFYEGLDEKWYPMILGTPILGF